MPLFNITWAAKTNAAMDNNPPNPSSLKSTLSSQEKSLKWIKVNNAGSIECSAKVGKELLSPLGRKRNLNFVSIMGAARGGKSFLANQLAKQDGLFQISNAADPCTTGIDISRHVLPATIFGSNSSSCVALLDVEGQGDRSMEYDARLATVVLSLSKVVLFNWRDGLQIDRILNLLSVYQRASHNIDLGDDDEPPFNHLHIVFRDWNFEGKNAEDVKDSLLGMEKRAQSQEAMLRNELRRTLVSAFSSISVWLFPPPVSNTEDLTRELGSADISPQFSTQLDHLRAKLGDQLSEPTRFGGKTLTGAFAQAIVPELVKILNSGEIVFPRSAYLNMLHQEVEVLRQAAEARAEKMMEAARRECDTSPQDQSELSVEIQSAVGEYMSVFESEANAVAGADGNGVKEQCRLLKEFLERSMNDILRYNESALVVHLKSGMKEALGIFETSFVESIRASLPTSEVQIRSMYNMIRKNALEVIRAIPASDEDIEEALKRLCDSMELRRIRLETENTTKIEASRATSELMEMEKLEFFRRTFSCDLDVLRQTGAPIPPSKLQEKDERMTTLGAAASQKFEKDVKDLLQRELKVAEREATLAVMMAMQATKNSLFKEIEELNVMLPITAEIMQKTCESMAEFARKSLKGTCEIWEMNTTRIKEQENILLIDTATILSALKERNALLLLQAEADANSFTHGKVTESLRKEAEAARIAEAAAIEAEAIATAHATSCQAETVAARAQADAHAAEKARMETFASFKQDQLVQELIKEAESARMAKVVATRATAEAEEAKARLVEMTTDDWSYHSSSLVEEEEPLKKKMKVDCSVIIPPPNVHEIEKARLKSDAILGRNSCGGGGGGWRDSIEDARKEAIEAREAREGLAATAVTDRKGGKSNGNEHQHKSGRRSGALVKESREMSREWRLAVTSTAVRAEGHKQIKSRTIVPTTETVIKRKGRNSAVVMDKKNILSAAREAAREAIYQHEEASVEAVKKREKD